jgi:conjugative relaxase-like TrwC/TraI family protein
MTIRRLSVGSGYKYLLKSIAVGDGPATVDTSNLVRYYSESGTPPGTFLGAGLAGLDGGRGVATGQIVTAENLKRMLQDCADPITGEMLGRAPSSKAVGGFDLTFSPSKSVAVAWALGDRRTRDVIYKCHQRAIADVLAYAERDVFRTRSGTRGCVEEEVLGVVAAKFTHFDSRDADPQLHDHVVVLNRVQATSDGRWRTLDSRGLFASTVMLSELHQGVLSDLLTKELGWEWRPRARRSSPVPKWEVAGVTSALMDEFSRRTADIVTAKDRLVADFETDHGRSPTDVEVLKLRQTATLATRRAKKGHSLAELTKQWTTRAHPYLDDEPTAWVHELGNNVVATFASGDFTDDILRDLARSSLEVVSSRRPTFSRANIQAEVLRQLQAVRFGQPSERLETAKLATDLALRQALLITTPSLHHTPSFLLRSDGSSKFRSTGHWLYTTTTLLDAEARLLAAGQRRDADVVPISVAATITKRRLPGRTLVLSEDQARCVQSITTSGRALDVLVGPAGTGKSTAMAGLRAVWEREYGPGSVLGLAPSAAAAEVLAEDIGIETDNLSKWLHENRQRGQRARELRVLRERARTDRRFRRRSSPLPRDSITQREDALQRWSLRAGQLVVVDEASLASTFALDELVSAASDAGAKVVLAGDWAQLSSIDAGGMFRTLVRDRGEEAATLSDVRRLRVNWEKRASLSIRLGKSSALSSYASHGRITEGSRDDLLDALYAAWKSDCDHGRRSLMLAGDAETVSELNLRVQADRVKSGAVIDVKDLGGGLMVGVNDLVVTRQNDRRLVTERGWVKNGDEWRVARVHANGSLSVVRSKGSGSVCLPSHYVREHVELAYASTAHRAQGRTFDTAHAFVSPTTTREVLYVALTRGADANNLYVDTHYDPDPDTGHEALATTPSALEVLEAVLRREGADVSATDVIRQAQSQSIAKLVAEYETIVGLADGERWKATFLESGLSEVELARTTSSSAYPTLISKLREAAQRGLDAAVELPLLVKGRSFEDADDVANVLHHRINHYLSAVGYPSLVDEQLVVGLFPRPESHFDADVERALRDRIAAIEQRARELATLALERSDRWVRVFGPAPTDIEACERWLRAVTDGAAYLELWDCDDFAENIVDSGSDDQESHRRRVLASIEGLSSDIRIRDAYLDTSHSMSDEVLAYVWNQEMVLER